MRKIIFLVFLSLLGWVLLSGGQKTALAYGKDCLRDTKACDRYGHGDGRGWVKNRGVLYLPDGGKILRMTADSTTMEVLSDHGFRYLAEFKVSPDSNYFLYQGYGGGENPEVYVYDIRGAAEFKLPGYGRVEFSPDSRFAMQTNMHMRTGPEQLILLDLAVRPMQARVIPAPIVGATLGDYRGADVKWSPDSKQFYVAVIAYLARGGPTNCAYFAYDIAGKDFARIDGYFLSTVSSEVLYVIVDGKRVDFP